MRGRFYRIIRDLHLYLGLFISPFVLVFAISVFFLVHSWLPRIASETSTTRVVSALPLPQDLTTLSGRPLINGLRRSEEHTSELQSHVNLVCRLLLEKKKKKKKQIKKSINIKNNNKIQT